MSYKQRHPYLMQIVYIIKYRCLSWMSLSYHPCITVIPLSDIGLNASDASLMMSGLLLMLSPHFNVLSK